MTHVKTFPSSKQQQNPSLLSPGTLPHRRRPTLSIRANERKGSKAKVGHELRAADLMVSGISNALLCMTRPGYFLGHNKHKTRR